MFKYGNIQTVISWVARVTWYYMDKESATRTELRYWYPMLKYFEYPSQDSTLLHENVRYVYVTCFVILDKTIIEAPCTISRFKS